MLGTALAEVVHHVLRELHVSKHRFELGRELVAALCLEFGDERALGVVGYRSAAKKTLRQVLLVVLLEDILLVQVSGSAIADFVPSQL